MESIMFKRMYGESIKKFHSTHEIDNFIAKKLGKRRLNIVSLDQNIVVNGGCIFEMSDVDIDAAFDDAISK